MDVTNQMRNDPKGPSAMPLSAAAMQAVLQAMKAGTERIKNTAEATA